MLILGVGICFENNRLAHHGKLFVAHSPRSDVEVPDTACPERGLDLHLELFTLFGDQGLQLLQSSLKFCQFSLVLFQVLSVSFGICRSLFDVFAEIFDIVVQILSLVQIALKTRPGVFGRLLHIGEHGAVGTQLLVLMNRSAPDLGEIGNIRTTVEFCVSVDFVGDISNELLATLPVGLHSPVMIREKHGRLTQEKETNQDQDDNREAGVSAEEHANVILQPHSEELEALVAKDDDAIFIVL